jgi:hypothetical protein
MFTRFLVMLILLLGFTLPTTAQASPHPRYDIGNPTLQQVYVDVTNGSDSNAGDSPTTALQTVNEAWNRIPQGQDLAETGYHILIAPGTYPPENLPNYWESRYGTAQNPIILEAANGAGTVILPSANIFDSRYIYFFNLTFNAGADAFHCERCDHLLLRGNTFIGAEPDTYNAQETLKINQSTYVYLEDNDISGAWDNAVDFVAVQYGHIVGNHIHNAGDWCIYLKGGSAYFDVIANTIDDCGTGGFTAGQGTGFQFMTAPYIQYEAYFIRFVNNIVHDTDGAGVGVQGGYNILIAHNTFYRIGQRSHILELVFGSRSCDGQPGDDGRQACDEFRQTGGWGNSLGADGENYVRIPNKHVYIVNNIFYNPAGYRSEYQHFTIFAPYAEATQADSGVPVPTLADDDVWMQGNVIWNGDANMPLGIESDAGCAAENPTCNPAQLLSDNAINTLEPILAAPENGDYRPASGSPILQAPVVPLPAFALDDLPPDIAAPVGDNTITVDFAGITRATGVVGAFMP